MENKIKKILIYIKKNPLPLIRCIVALMILIPGVIGLVNTVKSDMPYDQRTYILILCIILLYIGSKFLSYRGDIDNSKEEIEQ